MECRKDRHVLGFQGVHAGLEHVCKLTFVHKDGHLRLANGELGAVLDLVVVALEPVHHRVRGVVSPLDNVDELALDLVPNAHAVVALAEQVYMRVLRVGCRQHTNSGTDDKSDYLIVGQGCSLYNPSADNVASLLS